MDCQEPLIFFTSKFSLICRHSRYPSGTCFTRSTSKSILKGFFAISFLLLVVRRIPVYSFACLTERVGVSCDMRHAKVSLRSCLVVSLAAVSRRGSRPSPSQHVPG